MDDRCVQETTKKKGTTVFEGGGGMGRAGRVRMCQVKSYANNEKGFRNFEFTVRAHAAKKLGL